MHSHNYRIPEPYRDLVRFRFFFFSPYVSISYIAIESIILIWYRWFGNSCMFRVSTLTMYFPMPSSPSELLYLIWWPMEIELHHLVLFVVYLQIIHNEWGLYRDEAISLNWTYITNSGHVWFTFFKEHDIHYEPKS